jgi:hypothetical protein
MARINLTIPDPLYHRLERLRDRVNVSKVCAVALAKELDMLENTAQTQADSKVQRLVQRVLREREARDRWYLRGRQDGEAWAMDRASVDELNLMEEDWDEDDIPELDSLDEIDPDEYPSFNAKELLDRWVQADRKEGAIVQKSEVDWRAYVLGWYHGARDLWKKAKSALE